MSKQIKISDYEYIVSHFDGNRGDLDDIAAVPIVAALTNAQGIADKSIFFYNNNLSHYQKNLNNERIKKMRKGAAFAEKLGIETFDYQADLSGTTKKLVQIFNSGEKVLSFEGGPMEAVYRALEQTSKKNLNNITLISHSRSNERSNSGINPEGIQSRNWLDLKRNFPEITFIEIKDQNNGSNNDRGFYSHLWGWLDNTDNVVLKEARQLMKNAGGTKINDPSDAGMHFFAFTGNENGNPKDAKKFFDANPPSFVSSPTPKDPTNDIPDIPQPTTNGNVYQVKNGQVIIEAENTKLQGDWEKITVAGRQGILYDGANSYGKVPVGQTLEYSFKTDESGNYKIALHSARHRAAMQEFKNDLGNDAWVKVIDSQTNQTILKPTKLFTAFGPANDKYKWGDTFDANHKKFDAAVNLNANREYKLLISGRSDGYVIDRITLSNDGFLKNLSAPESPRLKGNPSQPADDPITPPDEPVSPPKNPPNDIPDIPQPTTNGNVYQVKNGQVIIEAENTKLQGDWEKITVAGRQGILYDGANSYGKVPVGQTLEYSFKTDESGNYKIALHSARHRAAMQEFKNDLGNDAWVKVIDSQTNQTILKPTKLFTAFGPANDKYKWGDTFDANHKKFDAAVNLNANREYKLLISGRSDGYVIDRITLSNDGFLKNLSAPESPRLKGNPSQPADDPITPPDDIDPQPKPKPQPDPKTTLNTIYGTTRDDVIVGTQGNDLIYGTNGRSNGRGDMDTLTGGQGADTFVLGEKDKVYFNDRRKNTIGAGDYAMITDFNLEEGDQIQLGGEPKDYRLGSVKNFDGQAIFLKTQGQDELIAMVADETHLNLASEAFIFD